jgi:hypothetical protein
MEIVKRPRDNSYIYMSQSSEISNDPRNELTRSFDELDDINDILMVISNAYTIKKDEKFGTN